MRALQTTAGAPQVGRTVAIVRDMRKQRLLQISVGALLLGAGVVRLAGGVETLRHDEQPQEARAQNDSRQSTPVIRLTGSNPSSPAAVAPLAPAPQGNTPAPLEPTLRLVSRTSGELALLDRQAPETFLTGMLPSPGDSRHDAQLNQRVVTASRSYIRDRTDLLREMMVSYIETEGTYDFSGDLERLRAIDQAYRDAVADLDARLPGVSQLPDVLGSTALPLPAFAEEAERAARPEPEVTFTEPQTNDNPDINERGSEDHEQEHQNPPDGVAAVD